MSIDIDRMAALARHGAAAAPDAALALIARLREAEEELAHTQGQRDAAILRAQRAEDGEQALAAHVERIGQVWPPLSADIASLFDQQPQNMDDGSYLVDGQSAHDFVMAINDAPTATLARRDAEKVRQGRAEALAIIMDLDAEEGLEEYINSYPIGDTGDYGSAWDKPKLESLLRADDSVWSLRDQADGEYWHNLGLREQFEQFKDRLIAEKQADALQGAAEAFDEMGDPAAYLASSCLKDSAAKIRCQAEKADTAGEAP